MENFSIAALICEANELYSCTLEARCSFVANFIRRDLMENLFCNSLGGGNPGHCTNLWIPASAGMTL